MFKTIFSPIQYILDYAADRRQVVLGLSTSLIALSLLAGPIARNMAYNGEIRRFFSSLLKTLTLR